ncbi:MAG: marine proteobacterial sortase target protein [Gammaproteobacteria bacterium]|nr:MAG: marine proteobacterial sortase target protein [Gammaproteobacteria bacterium]RLA60376.1 MAG: marine proteobacterial sortase target protein [Gammaproteobacteria bacterium]
MKYYRHVYRQLVGDAGHLGGVPLWLAFRCLPSLLLGALFLLMVLSTAPAQAMPERGSGEPDINGVESGQLLLLDQAGDTVTPALMNTSKVHFDISGMIATVSVEQSFRNDSDRWLEGVYAFPLPDNAAVRYLEMVIGERRIVGKVREKAVAKKIYQAAKKAGKKASLVEQQRPNLFTNRIANIGPGEEITVRMEYVQEVSFSANTFSLRFPMTITPRYMPGAPVSRPSDQEDAQALAINPYLGWAVPTDRVPDADAISPLLNPSPGSEHSPLNPIEITAQLDMGMPLANVESPYHDIALARRAGIYAIRLVSGVSEMDRDFVLNWRPVTGATPAAALFTQEVDGEHFGLLMVVPPAADRAAPAIPRELIFVVDTSGSMGGVAIEQARASVSRALQQLRPVDYFNIIEFNSMHRSLYRQPMPATRHHVQRALEFVRKLDASGGTEMLPALQAALVRPRRAADEFRERALLRQVIFITDGAVGNEVALFEEISSRLGSGRLFTVGIGSAPNSWFMRKAAQAGRGTHTHVGDLDEVGQKMADLFDQLAHPAAVDLTIDWPAPVEAWPQRLPDLYLGQPLLVAVNFGTTPPQGEVMIGGEINARAWTVRLQLGSGAGSATATGHKGVASLWARHKIAGLLDEKLAGRDEDAVRADVLPVALRHQLLSPYTSFVAVEEVISRPQGEGLDSKPVPNTRPHGQSPQGYAYPRTATTGPAKVWFGGLLLFLGIMLHVLRRGEVDHVPAVQS